MKKLKIVLLLLLTVPVYTAIAPAGSPILNNLCAAEVVERGNSCITVPSTCSGGYTNLSQANLQFYGMSSSDLATSIAGTAGFENKTIADMCLPPGLNQMIEVWVGDEESGAQGSQYLSRYEYRGDGVGTTNINFIPKVCPTSWRAQQIPVGFNVVGWSRPYGCCPTGYNLVGNSSQSNPLATQGAICCKPGRGGERATYWKEGAGCAYVAGGGAADTAPWSGVNPPDYTGTFDQLNQAIASGSGPEAILYVTGAGPANYPTLGLPLGPSSPVGLAVGARTSAPERCPANSQCTIQEGGGIGGVENANIYDAAGPNCGRCYSTGDVIGTSTADSGATDDPTTPINESAGFVRYCAGAGAVRDETLLGTPDITRGYLLEDATNQALYKQCFDTGGIYTAIGCVDPTPTGIITGLIRIALGVMGGVALLQMVYVGILYQQGNTEKIKGARTQLIATITGIAVLVFSVLILRIIGVNILDTVANGSV